MKKPSIHAAQQSWCEVYNHPRNPWC